MKKFNTVEQADQYLNDLAAKMGLNFYNVWEGQDSKGNEVMTLTEEDVEGLPIRDVKTVIFLNY